MSIRNTSDPDVLVMRSGGGVLLSVCGILFVLCGLGILAITLGWLPVEDGPPGLALGLAGSTVFLVAGLGTMGGRAGCTIDRRRCFIMQWWGIWVPWQRTVCSLGLFTELTLKKEQRETSDSSYVAYVVRLEGTSQQIELREARSYEQARALAERMAQFIDLPLSDYSSGAKVVCEPSVLHLSLRERSCRAGEQVEAMAPPGTLHSRVIINGTAVTVDIPPWGFTSQHVLMTLPLLLAWSMSVPCIVLCLLWSEGMRWFLLGFCVVAFGVIPASIVLVHILASARTSLCISAAPQGIWIKKRGLFRTAVTEIPGHELEDLHLDMRQGSPNIFGIKAPSMQIIARSNRKIATIAGELSREEGEYIYALLKKALVS
ncbi:MAG TPA: hypothetical protein VIH59_04160 [Candidatus Tectomicrobia bacterium]